MRIVPYTEQTSIEDLDNLYILIKAVPFDDSFAPAVVIVSPDDHHLLSVEELGSLMDGLEIAQERISEIIDFISHKKSYMSIEIVTGEEDFDDEDDEDEEDDDEEDE